MISKAKLRTRIEQAGEKRRWYQSVPYGSISSPNTHFGGGRTNYISYGEGRWMCYIKPMLEHIDKLGTKPKESSLCEVGCSAGLFLLRAWQKQGFNRLIGVDAGLGAFDQLLVTRDYYDEMPLEVYNQGIGPLEPNISHPDAQSLNMSTFPIVDITMLSCVHYHMRVNALVAYLRTLSFKSMYLVVLLDENAGGVINPKSSYLQSLITPLSDWDYIHHFSTSGKLLEHKKANRVKDLTILLFRSRSLKRLSIQDCWTKQLALNPYNAIFYQRIFPTFIEDVLSNRTDESNLERSVCFRWQRDAHRGSTAWGPKIARERVLSYINLIKTAKEHGQETPIALQLGREDPWDGMHRIAVLKYLEKKFVYGRTLSCSGRMRNR